MRFKEITDLGFVAGFVIVDEEGFKLIGLVLWDIEKTKATFNEEMVGKNDSSALVAVQENLRTHNVECEVDSLVGVGCRAS